MTATSQRTYEMNDRIARHFVWRLRREAERRAVEAAVEAGFLREECVDNSGRVLQIFHRGAALPDTASGRQVVAMLARQRRRLIGESSHPVLGNGDLFIAEDEPSSSASATRTAVEHTSRDAAASATEIVRAVRAAAEPPRASEVACLLLVAQAVTNGEHAERQVLDVLRRQQPIVAVHCETRHFETCFLDLLGRGLILPGEVTRCNGYELDRRRNFYFPNMPAAKWQIVYFAGKDRDMDGEEWRVGQAAQGPYPILVVSECERQVPARLVAAAQLKLDCGGLNAEIVNGTIEAVLGEQPTEELDDIDFGKLDLADLSIAIRPGATPSSAAATLRILAADPEGEPPDDDEPKSSSQKDSRTDSRSGSGSSGRRGKDHVSGSEIVQSKDISDADSGRFIERIETFSGCDEAREWALSLAVDLPLWQAGDLHWDEMSTKLLLSGPPGTGKTLFARSLCNSLQVPMFTTSIATWLEPAYLGDVVKRIKRAFSEAVAHHPAILFIDEIDGIGRRTDFTRDYADYWNALVNCLLELLDGAARTTGVIVVGATNHPAIIDPALLRPGRLSPHMRISPPDVAARMEILRHHLGGDLDTIIATAPKPTALASEDDLRSFLHTLPDAVLRDLAGKGMENIAWKGTP
ncbi:MAG: ATP-binding protein [Hyphomicrobiales bacterium]|nr:ATP-binding protein [Hyphomicrobiales bacterium]